MENSQPERTMSLMVDRPIPIPNTEYAYYIGELLPFNIAIYAWMHANDRYIASMGNLTKTYEPLNFRRKLGTLYMRRVELGFNRGTKTDEQIKEDLIVVMGS